MSYGVLSKTESMGEKGVYMKSKSSLKFRVKAQHYDELLSHNDSKKREIILLIILPELSKLKQK